MKKLPTLYTSIDQGQHRLSFSEKEPCHFKDPASEVRRYKQAPYCVFRGYPDNKMVVASTEEEAIMQLIRFYEERTHGC